MLWQSPQTDSSQGILQEKVCAIGSAPGRNIGTLLRLFLVDVHYAERSRNFDLPPDPWPVRIVACIICGAIFILLSLCGFGASILDILTGKYLYPTDHHGTNLIMAWAFETRSTRMLTLF